MDNFWWVFLGLLKITGILSPVVTISLSMATALLEQFGQAIKGRSPILAERLQPGLPEAKIRKMLQRAKVSGNAESILQLFPWKDGSELYTTISDADSTPLPHSPFMFLDLEMMVTHFTMYEEFVPYQPRFKPVAGKYFPFLWDGSDKWIALDLEGGGWCFWKRNWKI